MKCDEQLKNRLKRIEGQMRGVLSMMEKEASCNDVVVQLKAIKSGIERLMSKITTENLKQTLSMHHDIDFTQVKDALELIEKGIN